MTASAANFAFSTAPSAASQTFYSAGTQKSFKGPEAYFTGDVQVQMLFPGNDTAHYSGAYVTFQPGARTAWHSHPAGQHMVVTSGTGLTGTRDGKVVEIKQGDAIWCPPDIDHWHGATPASPMTHLVVTGSKNGENVVWKEKVTDAEYQGNNQRTMNMKSSNSADALTPNQQHMIPVAAFTASGDLQRLDAAIVAGLDAGLSVNEIKEIMIHLYAYAGFPRALNGLATLMNRIETRKAAGIEDPVGKEASALPAGKTSREFGEQVQTELVGKPVTGPLFDFAPAINEFLQSHLFGDLFGRGILDYKAREIATVSALASMDGVESQLNSHIAIANNVGLTKQQLTALASVLSDTVGEQAGSKTRQAIQGVLANKE
ncbi:(R)-mandelonitrile lyase [Microbulbifer sp.]|uniref:(R)-mandelonitrile lyase n=1 Tax=Microbulbifer sp. TaxID=1908541 RepID=UPI002F95FAFB